MFTPTLQALSKPSVFVRLLQKGPNLCASFDGVHYGEEVVLDSEHYNRTLDLLLETNGEVVNKWI